MKTSFTFFGMVFLTGFAFSQVPGGDFETWKTIRVEEPEQANWTVYDEDDVLTRIGLLSKSNDASNGNYAIRFDSYGTDDFGYVVYGKVSENGPSGGIPFADNPKKLTVSYKCNMAPGDSAEIWVWLFSGGVQITYDMFRLGGTVENYTDVTFTLSDYLPMPDSLMLAFAGGNPAERTVHASGNFICFDNARFEGGTQGLQIPDNSFEQWSDLTFDCTDEMFNIQALVTRTEDACEGNYAMKALTQNAQWNADEGIVESQNTLILWGNQYYVKVEDDEWQEYYKGGLPVTSENRIDTLVFYYKYTPAPGVTDNASLGLCFHKSGTEVINFYRWLLAMDRYTRYELPYDLDHNWTGNPVDVDSMVLRIETSKWRDNWKPTDININGSSLYIDHMFFKSQACRQTGYAESHGRVDPMDTLVIKGKSMFFSILPDNGYVIKSVRYNGMDVTGDVVKVDDNYRYSIQSVLNSGVLIVDFESATGYGKPIEVKNGYCFLSDTKMLYLNEKFINRPLELIGVSGLVLLEKFNPTGDGIDLSHLPVGIYILKSGNEVLGKLILQ